MNRYEDRYQKIRLLGAGAAGEVHLALDKATGREVAVKLLLSDQGSIPQARERFVQEAMILAKVRHPNVVQVYDAGHKADGTPYLAMELLTGTDLAEYVPAHAPLPWERVRELALGLARGLEAIHAAGIVHRDMKPANALVDAQGVPRISDFGLAKGPIDSGIRTKTGMVLGTPGYLAPEALRGEKSGAPGDVYALGLIFHFLHAGTLPWSTDEISALLREQLRGVPAAALEVLPAPLGELVGRMVALEPGVRPGATEVIARLEASPTVVQPRAALPRQADAKSASARTRALPDRNRPAASAAGPGRPLAPGDRSAARPTLAASTGSLPGRPSRGRLVAACLGAGLLAVLVIAGRVPGPRATSEATPGAASDAPGPTLDDRIDLVLGKDLATCFDRISRELRQARSAEAFGSRGYLVKGGFPNPEAWPDQRRWLVRALDKEEGSAGLRALLRELFPDWWGLEPADPAQAPAHRARRAGLARLLAGLARFDMLGRILSLDGGYAPEPRGGEVVPGLGRVLPAAVRVIERLDLDGRPDCLVRGAVPLLQACVPLAKDPTNPEVMRGVGGFNRGSLSIGPLALEVDKMYCSAELKAVAELAIELPDPIRPGRGRVGFLLSMRDLIPTDAVSVELWSADQPLVLVPVSAGGKTVEEFLLEGGAGPKKWKSYAFQVLVSTAILAEPVRSLRLRVVDLLDEGKPHTDHHVTVTGLARWDEPLVETAKEDDRACERWLAEHRRQASPDP